MKNVAVPLVGTEVTAPTLVLRQLAARFRAMGDREADPRLRHKLNEMAAEYERKAKLQDA